MLFAQESRAERTFDGDAVANCGARPDQLTRRAFRDAPDTELDKLLVRLATE